VPRAAQVLGITVDALRSRIKRNAIADERVGRRVYVLLDTDQARPGHGQVSDQPRSYSDALISEMQAVSSF
jgi:hypothetical protein